MTPRPDRTPSIAVIAGGIAGLATALGLRDRARAAGRDLRVTVFEKGAHSRRQPADHPAGRLATGMGSQRIPGQRTGHPAAGRPSGFAGQAAAQQRCHRPPIPAGGRPDPGNSHVADGLPPIRGCSPRRPNCAWPGELFVPARKDLGRAAEDPATDETIDRVRRPAAWARAFADTMLDPMVKGVFGGESRRLSLAAAFPRMVELEKDYGGLFKAMIKLARQKKKEGKSKTDAGPSGVLHSFTGGMATLIDALVADLGRRSDGRDLDRGRCPIHLPRRGWLAGEDPGRRIRAFRRRGRSRARPCGGPASWDISMPLSPNTWRPIPFAPMAVIALGFKREAVTHDLNGFGMLVPSREKRELLGVTVDQQHLRRPGARGPGPFALHGRRIRQSRAS